MKCPDCGKKMIRWGTGVVLTSNPPQYPWNWRCGCGKTIAGGVEWGISHEDEFRKQWERAQ